MVIGKAIYSILTAADLSGEATVHPEVAPESTLFPFVVYSIQNIQPSDQKTSTSTLDDSTLEVYIMSQDYGECMTVSEECRAALDRNGGSFNGVQVQSIQFETGEITYNEPQQCYYVEQIYSVRTLRTGTAPQVTLLPLNASSITIQETDGSPQFGCSSLKFPAGTLTIDTTAGTGLGVANYVPVWEYARFTVSSIYLAGGAQAIDFTSQTAAALPFNEEGTSSGSNISVNAGGRVFSAVDGWHRFTCTLDMSSDSQHHSFRFYLSVEGSERGPQSGGTIPGQHQVLEHPAVLTTVLFLEANQRVAVNVYDASNHSGAVYCESGYLEVERMA